MARTYTQLNKELGARIRARREALHMTREVLAERINVTPHSLGEMERGSIGMALTTYKQICEVLGIHDGYLLWGDRLAAQASAEEITNRLPQRLLICAGACVLARNLHADTIS